MGFCTRVCSTQFCLLVTNGLHPLEVVMKRMKANQQCQLLILVCIPVVQPDKSSMYLCAISHSEWRAQKSDFWDDVYGFKMTAMKEWSQKEAVVDFVPADTVSSAQTVNARALPNRVCPAVLFFFYLLIIYIFACRSSRMRLH